MQDFEQKIEEFYFDPSVLFPVYNTSSEFLEKLYSVSLINTEMSVKYSPEAIINYKSIGKIYATGDSFITGSVSRINTVVESTIEFYNLTAQALKYLINKNFTSGNISFSTAELVTNNKNYDFGIVFSLDSYKGEYYPNDFFVSKFVGTTTVTNQLSLQNSYELIFIEPSLPGTIEGTANIQIDSTNQLDFYANFSENHSFSAVLYKD